MIIGCMRWGWGGSNLSLSSMADLITFCVSKGLNTFDNADIYGDYTMEEKFGKAFELTGIKRNEIKIITKCGITKPNNSNLFKVKGYDYSVNHIIRSVELSLEHFKTSYIDKLLLHRPSPLLEVSQVIEAFKILKDQGKVKSFGVSNFTKDQFEYLNTYIKLEDNQLELSLINPNNLFNHSLETCIIHNVRPTIWSPLGGYFSSESEQVLRIKPVLNTLCEKYDATEAQLLLAWILKHPSKPQIVIGSTNKDRILEQQASKNIELDREDWFLLLESSRGFRVP